jgi:hypothetical protein
VTSANLAIAPTSRIALSVATHVSGAVMTFITRPDVMRSQRGHQRHRAVADRDDMRGLVQPGERALQLSDPLAAD